MTATLAKLLLWGVIFLVVWLGEEASAKNLHVTDWTGRYYIRGAIVLVFLLILFVIISGGIL